jgi:uncharacterized protein (TIGR02266 family)
VSSTQPRYPVSLRVALSTAEGALSGEVTDISAGGMFVRADRTLPVGALLSGALEIPDGERPAPVEAKVIHVAPAAGRSPISRRGFGAQFVHEDEAFRGRMERYIKSIQRRREVPVKLLLIARDLLFEKGWTQLTRRDSEGSYCLTGALARAAAGDRDAYRAALQSIGPRLGVPGCAFGGFGCHCALLTWNDREGRTRGEVVAKIDEAIQAALGRSASA